MIDVTAIVISFLRPGFTEACIRSLRKTYPDIHILVGENGNVDDQLRKACEEVGARYMVMPYDSGVCYARNRLVESVTTKYVLVGDDDFLYDNMAKVDAMRILMENRKSIDLIGGRIIENGKIRNYQGYTEKKGKKMYSHALDPKEASPDKKSGLNFMPADLTFNFFLAKSEKVRQVKWDEKIKVAYEHFSWFYDFKKAGNKASFSPEPIVHHKPSTVDSRTDPAYRTYRVRKNDRRRFFERFKIEAFVDQNGSEVLAPPEDRTEGIEFAITTFKRPESLDRLLMSIAKFYPSASVTVADQQADLTFNSFDGKQWEERKKLLKAEGLENEIKVIEMPYDCGLSHSRNRLVDSCESEMIFLLDDDFVFTERTDVTKLKERLESERLDMVAGAIELPDGSLQHYEGKFRREGDTLTQEPSEKPPYDYVFNFFLAKTKSLTQCRWDDTLKVAEHMDYFLTHKGKLKIGYEPGVTVSHVRERNPDYSKLRIRSYEMTAKAMRKHGLKTIINHTGDRVLLEDMESKAKVSEVKQDKPTLNPRLRAKGSRRFAKDAMTIGSRRFSAGEIVPDAFVKMLK